MASPLEPFSKHDFDHLWKSGLPKNDVYVVLRKLLEGKVDQLLEDASSRVAADKVIKVKHIQLSIAKVGNLYFVNKDR